MTRLLFLAASLLMTSCTYAVTMAQTEGESSDVIDETSSNTPSTNLSLPISEKPTV
jgi:hypothetical protein